MGPETRITKINQYTVFYLSCGPTRPRLAGTSGNLIKTSVYSEVFLFEGGYYCNIEGKPSEQTVKASTAYKLL